MENIFKKLIKNKKFSLSFYPNFQVKYHFSVETKYPFFYNDNMFLDTHCHLSTIKAKDVSLENLLENLVKEDFWFVLDIGTHCDDLEIRQQNVLDALHEKDFAEKAKKILFYTAGIWPAPEAINDSENQIKTLRKYVENHPEVIAIGECGLDHHWNVTNGVASGADFRDEAIFSKDFLKKEMEFFEMQLLLGKEKNLPIIVHSRDAFSDTLTSIKNVGYNNGVIHCYSYGIDEAREFLDLGWYIALGGAITYCKKSKIQEMKDLINFIPKDRLLIETDAPYLAPVPERGKINTPLLIKHTYQFLAENLGISLEELKETVNQNTKALFF